MKKVTVKVTDYIEEELSLCRCQLCYKSDSMFYLRKMGLHICKECKENVVDENDG